MKQRVLTALILVAIVTFPLLYGGIPLRVLIFAVATISSYEIADLDKKKHDWQLNIFIIISIIILYNVKDSYYLPILILYIISLFCAVIISKDFNIDKMSYTIIISLILTLGIKGVVLIREHSVALLFYIAIATYMTDTSAYLVGVKFGKHKLIPRLSPKKTWEGAIGGYLGGLILSLVFGYFFVELDFGLLVFLSLTIPFVSEIGDLSFSAIKRHFDVKDFGTIFPGHGGVLDRIDSLLFSLVFTYAIVVIYVLRTL